MLTHEKQTSVNYIWISSHQHDTNDTPTLSSINHTALDFAFENARNYPFAAFTLWIDNESLDPSSRFFLESHAYLSSLENLTIKNLRDLDKYRNDPIFDQGNKIRIRAKADYARIIVLDHTAHQAKDGEHIFYSDLDAPDIEITAPQVQRVLQSTGIACAATIDGLENGYIGLHTSKETRTFIQDLCESTREAAAADVYARRNLVEAVISFGATKGYRSTDFWAKKMPDMGKQIPTNPAYIECGLN